MRKWIFLLIIIGVGIFEVAFLDAFRIFGAKPDLLFIGIVIAALVFDLRWALFLAVVAGILKDTFSINIFGINTLLFTLWTFLLIRLSKKISLNNYLILISLIFIINILQHLITRSIFLSLDKSVAPLGIFLRTAFLGSLYTAAIFFLILRRMRFAD